MQWQVVIRRSLLHQPMIAIIQAAYRGTVQKSEKGTKKVGSPKMVCCELPANCCVWLHAVILDRRSETRFIATSSSPLTGLDPHTDALLCEVPASQFSVVERPGVPGPAACVIFFPPAQAKEIIVDSVSSAVSAKDFRLNCLAGFLRGQLPCLHLSRSPGIHPFWRTWANMYSMSKSIYKLPTAKKIDGSVGNLRRLVTDLFRFSESLFWKKFSSWTYELCFLHVEKVCAAPVELKESHSTQNINLLEHAGTMLKSKNFRLIEKTPLKDV